MISKDKLSVTPHCGICQGLRGRVARDKEL